MLKKLLFLCLMFMGCVTIVQANDINMSVSEKMYIDEDDFTVKGNAFHIHIGHNVWLVTHTVHRDTTGLFTYECNIIRSMNGIKIEYERQWKCPYCYQYWPIGKPCENKDCPSRYK